MDIHVFDVHCEVLQGSFRLQAPEPNKIPLKRKGSYPGTAQQSGLLHQSVHFFMVDDPSQLPELSRHIFIAIAAEFLSEDRFYLHHNGPVVDPFTTDS
jgi:hypothetical protein